MRNYIRRRIRCGQEVVIDNLLLLDLMYLRLMDELLGLLLLLRCLMRRSMTGHHNMHHVREHVRSALQLGCHISNSVEADDVTWVVSD